MFKKCCLFFLFFGVLKLVMVLILVLFGLIFFVDIVLLMNVSFLILNMYFLWFSLRLDLCDVLNICCSCWLCFCSVEFYIIMLFIIVVYFGMCLYIMWIVLWYILGVDVILNGRCRNWYFLNGVLK